MRKAPFFSRFVEQQAPRVQPELDVKTDLKAGRVSRPPVTLKYPSDNDEGY